MDIRQLKHFLEICKCGTISRAAVNLYISEQGLSSSVKRMEADLNCTLFYRKGNALVLTEDGVYLRDHAAEIVERFDMLLSHFLEQPAVESNIRLLCAYSLLAKSPVSVQSFIFGADTGLHITVSECYTSEMPSLLRDHRFRYALGHDLNMGPDYRHIPLYRVEHCFIAHRDHPVVSESGIITVSDLDGARLIFPDRRAAVFQILNNHLRKSGIDATIVFQSTQPLQMVSMIRNDPTLIARIALDDATALTDKDIRILRLSDIDFFTTATLCYSKTLSLSIAERYFIQSILNASGCDALV